MLYKQFKFTINAYITFSPIFIARFTYDSMRRINSGHEFACVPKYGTRLHHHVNRSAPATLSVCVYLPCVGGNFIREGIWKEGSLAAELSGPFIFPRFAYPFRSKCRKRGAAVPSRPHYFFTFSFFSLLHSHNHSHTHKVTYVTPV